MMRFEDVSDRLNARVNNTGGRGHGMPLSIAVPGLRNVKLWQAVYGGYSWAIMFEPGLPQWSAQEKAKHVGYSASYRRSDQRSSRETIRIDGGPWDSFAMAEAACKRTWRQIRSAS